MISTMLMQFAQVQNLLLNICSLINGTRVLDESLLTLKIDFEFFNATMEDVKQKFSFVLTQQGKKRKRDDVLLCWLAEASMLSKEVQLILKGCRNFFMHSEMINIVHEKIKELEELQRKGEKLLRFIPTGECAKRCGAPIPVRELMGVEASFHLKTLQELLLDPKVGRIAIHGKQGMGKTILMKHLYNWALNFEDYFNYVIWVSLPNHFSIKPVQKAVAAAISCALPDTDDLITRAEVLSRALSDLGSFVLFLDGIPEARFCLKEIGISVPTEGSECKLVLTTCSSSVCGRLDCTGELELKSLKEEDAQLLFVHYASLDDGSNVLLTDIACLIAKICGGVPRLIEEVAVSMRYVVDIREWRHKLSELINLLERDKKLYQVLPDEIENESKKTKK